MFHDFIIPVAIIVSIVIVGSSVWVILGAILRRAIVWGHFLFCGHILGPFLEGPFCLDIFY